MHFDPALRDEVVARVDRLKLPSYTGFVMPRLEAVTRRGGRDHRRRRSRIRWISPRRCSSTRRRRATCVRDARRTAACARELVAGSPSASCSRALCCSRAAACRVAQAARRRTRSPILAGRGSPGARPPRDLAVIRSGARSGDAQTVRVAVRALGRLERPALIADIMPALRHPLPEVRAEAANAIGQAAQGWKREQRRRPRAGVRRRRHRARSRG